ncbi:MAG: Lsr2 family protein [Streptomyces sp.]|nr:Lsr2 family protein [Streptomyces sp.]
MEIVIRRVADDLDNTQDAAETIPFSFDGMDLEIDLSEENALRFRLAMAEFVNAARPRVKKAPKGKTRKSRSGYDVPKVRAWWFDEWETLGLPEASDRARIPNVVRDAAIEHGVIPPLLQLAA